MTVQQPAAWQAPFKDFWLNTRCAVRIDWVTYSNPAWKYIIEKGTDIEVPTLVLYSQSRKSWKISCAPAAPVTLNLISLHDMLWTPKSFDCLHDFLAKDPSSMSLSESYSCAQKYLPRINRMRSKQDAGNTVVAGQNLDSIELRHRRRYHGTDIPKTKHFHVAHHTCCWELDSSCKLKSVRDPFNSGQCLFLILCCISPPLRPACESLLIRSTQQRVGEEQRSWGSSDPSAACSKFNPHHYSLHRLLPWIRHDNRAGFDKHPLFSMIG